MWGTYPLRETLFKTTILSLMARFEGKKIDPKLFHHFLDHAQQYIKKTKTTVLEITEDDFDPCQPHSELPIAISDAAAVRSGKTVNVGRVTVIEEPEDPHKHDFGKIVVVDDDKKKPAGGSGQPFRKK